MVPTAWMADVRHHIAFFQEPQWQRALDAITTMEHHRGTIRSMVQQLPADAFSSEDWTMLNHMHEQAPDVQYALLLRIMDRYERRVKEGHIAADKAVAAPERQAARAWLEAWQQASEKGHHTPDYTDKDRDDLEQFFQKLTSDTVHATSRPEAGESPHPATP